MLQHMSNLIVILFNFMYPVLYVGFLCIGCVCERVKTQDKLKIKGDFMSSSREDFLRSEAMCSAHDWNAKSHDRWWQLVFTSVSRVKPSCEILTKHSILPFCHIWYTRSLLTLYIYPHYPHIERRVFQRENPSHYPWEWEIVIPTIFYTIHCGFFNSNLSISKSLRGW